MKIGCQMPFNDRTSPAYIAEAGALVEELGYHSIWVPEHVLFFPEYHSAYPYADDGKIAGDPRSLLEPFSALTFVAANTSSIKLCTGICLVPQRNPIYTAKQVADLDYLSNGRVEFGAGIGWLREEFAALGVPWEDRAGRTRECIELMKTLWCDEVSQYEGKYFTLSAAYQNPKPVQKPYPPLFFGGESNAALQRVADQGQGWYGFNLTPATFESRLIVLEKKLERAGRKLTDCRIYVSPHAAATTSADIKSFKDLGAEQIILPLVARDTAKLAERAKRTLDLVHSA